MTTDFLFRQGTKEDLVQIRELAVKSYGQYKQVLTAENWSNLNKALNDEKALLVMIKKSFPFVCTDNDLIVGMAFLYPRGNPTDIYQADWSFIRLVGVDPPYTGQGIAKKLTQMCIDRARSLNEKTIALHTSEFMDAARHIYESLGFKILKELPLRLGKRYWLYTLDL